MTPIRVVDVKNTGWYLVFDKVDFGKKELPGNFLGPYSAAKFYQYDNEGNWRSDTGHGVTLEQPDYFDDNDYCVGPIKNINCE